MKYRFHPEAVAEYGEAVSYYATRQPGLDLRSIECAKRLFEALRAPHRSNDGQDAEHIITMVGGAPPISAFESGSLTAVCCS